MCTTIHVEKGYSPAVLGVLLGVWAVFVSPPAAASEADPPLVAIYADQGTWEDGIIASEAAWDAFGVATVRVLADDIRHGALMQVDVLEVPGGWAGDYAAALGEDGLDAIRAFVSGGGGYFGICAGAYLASSRVRWSGLPIRYGLDLVDVLAVGPLDAIAPWPNYAMTQVAYQPHPITQGLPSQVTILYYGGARFRPLPGAGVDVVADYADPNVAPCPAMVAAAYGSGRVFLTALHPEIEEGNSADGVTGWDDGLQDPESDWPLMEQALAWLIGGN